MTTRRFQNGMVQIGHISRCVRFNSAIMYELKQICFRNLSTESISLDHKRLFANAWLDSDFRYLSNFAALAGLENAT
jgi:hypothetical protein